MQIYKKTIKELRSIYNSSEFETLNETEMDYVTDVLHDTNKLEEKIEDYFLNYGKTKLSELLLKFKGVK